jgi:shikimate dehydrogenase
VELVSREAKNKNQLTYNALNKTIITDRKLIINTTPLGTYPNIESFPEIPYEFLNEEHLLFDLVYNPSTTAFMQKGINQKAAVVNGYDMLVFQAEENWKIWNNL